MKDKEKIYDTEISPLIKKVLAVCKKHKIPMFCDFQFADEGFCKSVIRWNESHKIWAIYEAMSQCKEGNVINIDKFLLWICRTFDNSGSSFLYKYQTKP